MAAAVLLFIFAMNLHLPSVRDETADQERSHEKLVRTAYAWLTIAFSIEAWYATRTVAADFQPDFLEGGGARHALALGFVTQMIFGVGARALPVFAGKQIHSRRLVDVTWVLINIAVVMRVGHAIIPAGSMTFRFDDIAVSGALGLIAVLVFAYNIARSVRPAQQSQPQVEEEQMPTLPPPPYSVTNSSVVADVIKNVPGSLDVLVSYGFKPLADPELRARVASSVTLGMACDMHGVDLQALISDITALQNGEARAASPRQRILNALRECYDPEIPVNIVDLGLVYEVEADDRHAVVRLTLTSPDCPVADQVVSDVTDRLRRLGIPDVKVSLIREPAWDPSRMTPAARQALGAP
jgi:metal-sulfur cluster biosynthetic enzyme